MTPKHCRLFLFFRLVLAHRFGVLLVAAGAAGGSATAAAAAAGGSAAAAFASMAFIYFPWPSFPSSSHRRNCGLAVLTSESSLHLLLLSLGPFAWTSQSLELALITVGAYPSASSRWNWGCPAAAGRFSC